MPTKKTQVKLTKADKFRECPACYGPIDYFNSCRKCGRGWTPELTETEKLEQSEAKRDPEDEEEKPALVGERKTPLERDKKEITGKKAKVVGTKKNNPFKLWEIQDGDNDAEISRKRSLMRLDSHKVYNQMGLVMRAYQNQKAVMISLTRLWGFLDEDERDEFSPTADLLKQGLMGLAKFSAKKVDLAAAMEDALLKERRRIHVIRGAKDAISLAAKKATKLTTPGADSEGFETIDLADLDPDELMEQVRIQLALKQKQKKSRFEQEVEEEEEN